MVTVFTGLATPTWHTAIVELPPEQAVPFFRELLGSDCSARPETSIRTALDQAGSQADGVLIIRQQDVDRRRSRVDQ